MDRCVTAKLIYKEAKSVFHRDDVANHMYPNHGSRQAEKLTFSILAEWVANLNAVETQYNDLAHPESSVNVNMARTTNGLPLNGTGESFRIVLTRDQSKQMLHVQLL